MKTVSLEDLKEYFKQNKQGLTPNQIVKVIKLDSEEDPLDYKELKKKTDKLFEEFTSKDFDDWDQ